MAVPLLDSRLIFLSEAGRFLASRNPTVAANLNSESTRLILEVEEQVPEVRKAEVCVGCGTRLTPGETSEVRVESERKKKRKGERKSFLVGEGKASSSKGSPAQLVTTSLVVRCLVCESRSIHPLPKEPKATIGSGLHSEPQDTTSSSIQVEEEVTAGTKDSAPTIPPITGSTATGKKKRIKKPKSLQSLLAQKKNSWENPHTSTILGLMDLMKRSDS